MQLDETRERLQRASGLVLVDKPSGPSSHTVVRATAQGLMRGRTAREGSATRLKAGHAGTLDPAASGLLLVLVGPSTRLARYLVGLDKRYRTEIQLGQTTTTGDAEGEPLERTPIPPPDTLPAALIGELELPVPAASAVKIDGERAYARHRRGEQIEMPTRTSRIDSVEVVAASSDCVTLDLDVSSGTYIRAIAEHIGGHCRSIRRLSVGGFRVDDSDAESVLAPLEALAFLPRVELTSDGAEALQHGRQIACEGSGVACARHAGELVAVINCTAGLARPQTVIAP